MRAFIATVFLFPQVLRWTSIYSKPRWIGLPPFTFPSIISNELISLGRLNWFYRFPVLMSRRLKSRTSSAPLNSHDETSLLARRDSFSLLLKLPAKDSKKNELDLSFLHKMTRLQLSIVDMKTLKFSEQGIRWEFNRTYQDPRSLLRPISHMKQNLVFFVVNMSDLVGLSASWSTALSAFFSARSA